MKIKQTDEHNKTEKHAVRQGSPAIGLRVSDNYYVSPDFLMNIHAWYVIQSRGSRVAVVDSRGICRTVSVEDDLACLSAAAVAASVDDDV